MSQLQLRRKTMPTGSMVSAKDVRNEVIGTKPDGNPIVESVDHGRCYMKVTAGQLIVLTVVE
jgi:hypothetical protein